jgi:hypothetical protein
LVLAVGLRAAGVAPAGFGVPAPRAAPVVLGAARVSFDAGLVGAVALGADGLVFSGVVDSIFSWVVFFSIITNPPFHLA